MTYWLANYGNKQIKVIKNLVVLIFLITNVRASKCSAELSWLKYIEDNKDYIQHTYTACVRACVILQFQFDNNCFSLNTIVQWGDVIFEGLKMKIYLPVLRLKIMEWSLEKIQCVSF